MRTKLRSWELLSFVKEHNELYYDDFKTQSPVVLVNFSLHTLTVVEKHWSTVKTHHPASSRVEGLKKRASLPGSIPPLSTWLLGRCSDDTVTSCLARSAYSTTFMHILPAHFLCSVSSSRRRRRYAKSLVTLAVLIRESDRDPTHPQFLGTPVNALGRLH